MRHFRMRTPSRWIWALWAMAAVAQPVPAPDAKPDPTATSPFSMDLDSLFNTRVTTASKFAEKLSDAPGVISVVSRDALRRFGGVTLREILERVAGLSGFRTGVNDRSIVSARGNQARVNGGHVLLLINGRPTREVAEGGVNEDILESFPVNSLERMEVIKGPGSVLYGSDAFSGVIPPGLVTGLVTGLGLCQWRYVAGPRGADGAFRHRGLAEAISA